MAGNPGDPNFIPEPPFPSDGPPKNYWWYLPKQKGVPASLVAAIEAAKPLWGAYKFAEANNMVEAAKRAYQQSYTGQPLNYGNNAISNIPVPDVISRGQVNQVILKNIEGLAAKVNSTATALRAMNKNAYVTDAHGKKDSMIANSINLAWRANDLAYSDYSREVTKAIAAGIQGVSNKVIQSPLDIGIYGSVVVSHIGESSPTNFPPLPTSCPPPPPPPPVFLEDPKPPTPVNPVTGDPLIPVVDKPYSIPERTLQLDNAEALANSSSKPMGTSSTISTPPKPLTPLFTSSANFKPGKSAAANAKGAKDLAEAAQKAASAAKLSPKQTKQLMDNVAKAIAQGKPSGNNKLAKPKAPNKSASKPLSRPTGSSPGSNSTINPRTGCWPDGNGNTICA